MNKFPSFYQSFYGPKFFRYFRRPPDFELKGFQIQFTVNTPKQLFRHIQRNSGFHPCYIQTYDHGSIGNLKRNDPNKMVFERAFFDFDVHHDEYHQIKKELHDLRSHSLRYKLHHQDELKEKLRNLIVQNYIVESAINEAKDFAINFKKAFGTYPILFFSGGKGCHAYTFFKSIQQVDINRVISWFGKVVKDTYNYNTFDLSVLKDSKSRLSRVPYTKHQDTDLTVIPFTIEDSYDEIINKSLNPVVETFQKDNYLSTLGKQLKTIDPILKHNEDIKKTIKKATTTDIKQFKPFSRVKDHRIFFRELLGSPKMEYPDKEYVMYCCPFKDHNDTHPSFMVHKTGYNCFGCGRKGNYWQFLKDYNGWNDKQVRMYLKSHKLKKNINTRSD